MKTRSPLRAKPLRNPGESTSDQLSDLLLDKLMPWMTIAMFAFVLAILEWVRWATNARPNPVLLSLLALAMLAIAIWPFMSLRGKIRNLKQGRDGEKAVGQFLERLRSQGAHVLHDFPGDGFNLDHVVIHTAGVFVVETKTISKPAKGNPVILFDGTNILIDGFKPDRDPVVQAQSAARWLGERIAESTGRSFRVKPVVVFPGWFIETSPEVKRGDLWVLNPKALPSFIGNAPSTLRPDEVTMIALHLSRFARATL